MTSLVKINKRCYPVLQRNVMRQKISNVANIGNSGVTQQILALVARYPRSTLKFKLQKTKLREKVLSPT